MIARAALSRFHTRQWFLWVNLYSREVHLPELCLLLFLLICLVCPLSCWGKGGGTGCTKENPQSIALEEMFRMMIPQWRRSSLLSQFKIPIFDDTTLVLRTLLMTSVTLADTLSLILLHLFFFTSSPHAIPHRKKLSIWEVSGSFANLYILFYRKPGSTESPWLRSERLQ
jgi:hypothetical protein